MLKFLFFVKKFGLSLPFYLDTFFRNFQVSIMQIASETKAYILDLIKLHGSASNILDDCLTRILHSHRILKLGE